jgi:glycosyltransferase involved in cell wall biosynthesis
MYIERSVRSVLQQTYQNLEIIVVDDGSTDDTLQILQKLQHEDHRLKILQQEKNLGAQAARNTGIRAATALYIAFLDSDDEWLASKLEKQLSLIDQSNDKIGVVYAGFKGKIYNDALRGWIADTNTLVVRKDILYKIGLLNEGIRAYQEWDLCIKLSRYTEFDFVNEPLAIYHLHDQPTISKNLVNDALGYLDIIMAHKNEIVTELGNDALAEHFLSASLRFTRIDDFKTARKLVSESIRISHLKMRSKLASYWILFHLNPSSYKALTSILGKMRSFYRNMEF